MSRSAPDTQPVPLLDCPAVVTGGTRGIGRAITLRLASLGAHVHCVYRGDESAAASVVESLPADCSGRIDTVRADVTDAAALESAFAVANAAAGPAQILVNNAGGPCDGLLLRASDDQLSQALSLNFEAAVRASRIVLPAMLKARGGRIVNVSSVVAAMGNSGQTLYGASKAALEGFTRSLAREVGRKGVTVNCVAPGFIETDATASLSDEHRKKALEATALARFGRPEDVAGAVAYLCSADAAYVTGTVLQVNGGMYM